MKHFYTIFILVFFTVFMQSVYSQNNCFVQLSDATGIEYTQDQIDSLEAAACDLIQTLPAQFQSDFKVYDFGFYRHNNVMIGGVGNIWTSKVQNIASNSTYFLVYGKELDSNGSLKEIHVEYNFPSSDYFQCFTESFEGVVNSDLKQPFYAYYSKSLNSGGSYSSQKSSLHNITEAFSSLSACCDSGNFNNCDDIYEEEKIVSALKSMGFAEVEVPNYEVVSNYKVYNEINSDVDIRLEKESGNKSYSITDDLENWFSTSPEMLQANVTQINETNKSSIHEFTPMNANGYDYSEDLVLLDLSKKRLFFRLDRVATPPTALQGKNQRPVVLPYFAYVVLKRAVMAAGGVAVDVAINIAIEKYVGGHATWAQAWENTELSPYELCAAAVDGAFADKKMVEFAANSFVIPIEYLVTTPYEDLSWAGFGGKIGQGVAVGAFSVFFGDYVGKFFKSVAKHFNFNTAAAEAFESEFKYILKGVLEKPGAFWNIRSWVEAWEDIFTFKAHKSLRTDSKFLKDFAGVRPKHVPSGPMVGKKIGHTFEKHGSHNTEQLLYEAVNSGKPVSQWLDDEAAEDFIARHLSQLGQGTRDIPVPTSVADMGRVFKGGTGEIVDFTHIRLVPSGSGVGTAYPINSGLVSLKPLGTYVP